MIFRRKQSQKIARNAGNLFARACVVCLLFLVSTIHAATMEETIERYAQQDPAKVVELLVNMQAETYQAFSPEVLVKASYAAATTANTDLALLLTDILLIKAKQLEDDLLIGQAHYNRGAAYAFAGKHDLALDSLLLSLSSYESVESEFDITRIKAALALIYVEIGEYELAEPYFTESIEFHEIRDDKLNLAKVLANRGFMRIKLTQYSLAKQDILRSLEYSQELGLKSIFPVLYKNLGRIESELANPQQALNYFKQSLQLAEADQLQHLQSETQYEIARLYYSLEQVDAARESVLQSIGISKQFDLLKELRDSYFLLSELEASQENYKAAYFAKENALKTSEKMGESRIAGNLSRLDRYTTRIKEQNKRLLLEQQKEIATLAAEREQLLKNFSFAFATVALFIAVYFIRRFSHSNKQAIIYEKQSKIDAMTGVWNRRAGEAKLARLSSPQNSATPNFSIAMLDIDHFKNVNDTHGHDIGDQVIIAVCNLIQENLRPSDMLCRWGGEEFIILWDQCDANTALDVCERIRQKIASTIFPPVGKLTVSIGISSFDNDDIYELIKRGDQALYHAKHSGRNCVMVKHKAQPEFLGSESIAVS